MTNKILIAGCSPFTQRLIDIIREHPEFSISRPPQFNMPVSARLSPAKKSFMPPHKKNRRGKFKRPGS